MSGLNVDSIFGSQELDSECPGCGHQIKVSFHDLAREGNEITCSGCHKPITIEHTPETAKGLKDANKALRDLENTMKKFGK